MSALLSILCFLCAGAAAGAMAWRLSRRRPLVAGGPEGRAAPDAGRAGPLASAAAGLGAGLIALAPFGLPLVLGLGCLALAAVALVSLLPEYEVVWTPDGLEGPSALLVPPFGPRRDFILWRHLQRIGRDAFGNRFVEDRDGNRITWNWLYAGEGHLLARLETVRPDLMDDGGDDEPDQGTDLAA